MLAMAGPEDDARSTRAAVKLVSGAVRPAPASHVEHMRYRDGQASHIYKQNPRCGCGMAPGCLRWPCSARASLGHHPLQSSPTPNLFVSSKIFRGRP
jgi:hypothetical protein